MVNKIPRKYYYMYVDAMPSEQLDLEDPNAVISLVAVGYTYKKRKPFKIRQFKNYRSQKRKLKAVNDLCQLFNENYFYNLRVACGLAYIVDVIRWGEQVLDNLPASIGGITPDNKYLRFNETKIPIQRAKAFAWYTFGITMLSAPLASFAKASNARKAYLLLDPLPGDTPGEYTPGIQLVQLIIDNSELKECWKKASEKFKGEIGFSYAGMKESSSQISVKQTDLAVLADWISHACHALANTQMILSGGFTERERRILAEPACILHKKKKLKIINFGIELKFETSD